MSKYFLTAYTLELKHHFRRSVPSLGSEECDAWRDRVVLLEAELERTRAAASSEHIGKNVTRLFSPRSLSYTTHIPFFRAARAEAHCLDICTTESSA